MRNAFLYWYGKLSKTVLEKSNLWDDSCEIYLSIHLPTYLFIHLSI